MIESIGAIYADMQESIANINEEVYKIEMIANAAMEKQQSNRFNRLTYIASQKLLTDMLALEERVSSYVNNLALAAGGEGNSSNL